MTRTLLTTPSFFLLTMTSVIIGCVGCATSGGGVVDVDQFPTRDELTRLAARDLPPLKADVHADVPSWTLKGPLPDRFGDAPVSPGGVNDLLLAAVPATHTSANVECAARELAAFFIANDGKHPEARLRSWMLVRCGVTSGGVSTHSLTWKDLTDETSDADLWKESRDDIMKMLDAKKSDAHVGIAFARDAARGVALLLVVSTGAKEDATLVAASQLVPAGTPSLVIDGALNAPAEVVYAYATKGLLEAAECTLDLTMVLPRFRFTCPVDAADASARIDIVARRKGRVLSEGVASLLAVRDIEATRSYREVIYEDTDAAHAGTGMAATSASSRDLLAAINRVRATSGHKPLRPVAAQSESVKSVAPHYFANMLAEESDPAISDVVALGLMAGWDVTELTINNAGFATLLDGSGGGDDLLGSALDHPFERAILLDPKVNAAAIGQARLKGDIEGAIVVTYEELVPPDHEKASAAVFEKLRVLRQQRGLGVTGSIPTEKIMLDAAQKIQAGGDMDAIAHAALKASVDVMGRGFTIWRMELHDVEHVSFPDELLTPRTTYVAIAVATRKVKNSAWGSTAVLLLGFVDDTRVASRDDGVVRSSR